MAPRTEGHDGLALYSMTLQLIGGRRAIESSRTTSY
jgi:hypothetical protein